MWAISFSGAFTILPDRVLTGLAGVTSCISEELPVGNSFTHDLFLLISQVGVLTT